MSVITRARRLNERPMALPTATPASTVPTPTRRFLSAEAPERATVPTEAPESRQGRSAEAPDAGVSRGGSSEQEFTHGRSQS